MAALTACCTCSCNCTRADTSIHPRSCATTFTCTCSYTPTCIATLPLHVHLHPLPSSAPASLPEGVPTTKLQASPPPSLPCLVALQVDVYSFAMIMYQLFEGHQPFSHLTSLDAAAAASLKGQRPAFVTPAGDKVHERLRALIQQCWAQDSAQRPLCKDMAEELRELLE